MVRGLISVTVRCRAAHDGLDDALRRCCYAERKALQCPHLPIDYLRDRMYEYYFIDGIGGLISYTCQKFGFSNTTFFFGHYFSRQISRVHDFAYFLKTLSVW